MSAFLSTATVASVGLTCKTLLNLGFCQSLTVNGLPILLDALNSTKRNSGQGIITVSNHISTLDDPVTWGVLPTRCYLSSRTTRWALGASDIMFTNPVFSTFFRLGQTLETFRGKGIYQPAVDTAIQKLDQGGWVHLYGEGKINQPSTYPIDEQGIVRLPRFKWGVGRILMKTNTPPLIIPMWLAGFEGLMPEGRALPYKYLPRSGARLSVSFGTPIPADEIANALKAGPRARLHGQVPTGWIQAELRQKATPEVDSQVARDIRIEVTAIIRREVEALGKAVSGDSLSGT